MPSTFEPYFKGFCVISSLPKSQKLVGMVGRRLFEPLQHSPALHGSRQRSSLLFRIIVEVLVSVYYSLTDAHSVLAYRREFLEIKKLFKTEISFRREERLV